ncbi:MAG: sugar transferase [Chitinispirillaceae bacterium]|nr:sugar transferase [Chitinispirillaceae bacterium]
MDSLKDCYGLYTEIAFTDFLQRERKRTERNEHPFALILVNIESIITTKDHKKSIKLLVKTIGECFRDIDVLGWYKEKEIIGIICPDLLKQDVKPLQEKIEKALDRAFTPEFRDKFSISYLCFPRDVVKENVKEKEESEEKEGKRLAVYPELHNKNMKKVALDVFKRAVDIIIASTLLFLSFPVMLIIAILIKIDSKGPVFFKQKRVGLGGKEFTFFKFRTMQVNNDPSFHKDYVKKLIQGKVDDDTKIFKIVNDPRVTRVGKFLRKTSLDELPQFINVLKGDMSIVGPRPPIPYEVEEYKIWHLKRVMEIKPGITGPWQVYGRNTTTFDDMVRMDINYIKKHNPIMDIILMLKTPSSLIKGY